MKDILAEVLKDLGQQGIQAFYVYLIVDYVSLWILIGLCAWGIRAIWAYYKANN